MKIRLPARKAAPPLKRPPRLKLKASVARSRRAPIVEEEDEDFLEEPEPNMKLSHAFVVVLVLHVIAVAGVFAFNSIKARQADVFSATKDEKTAAATSPAAANAADPSAGDGGQTSDPSNGAGGGSAQPNPPANQATAAATPGASATPAAAPATAGSAKTHEMQPGETLTKVASEYGVSITDLEKANNITDPKKIRAGTVLNIPEGGAAPAVPQPAPATAAATTATEAAASPAAASTVRDSGQVYTVAKGDNPWKIAKKLKVPYTELMELNGNPDPKKLQIGQKLKVPASAKAPAAK
jgi:LysM repeat protein